MLFFLQKIPIKYLFSNFSKIKIRKLTSPALIEKKIIIYPQLELTNNFYCQICKDTGFVPCSLCKKGCIMCGYTQYVICKCQFNI